MSQDNDLPPLDDFEEELKTLQYTHNPPKSTAPNEDYTKVNVRHIEDEAKQSQQVKKIEESVKNMQIKIDKEKEKTEKQKKNKEGYSGLKKGFFNSSKTQKTEKITEIKPTKPGSDPLRIPQVQQAMKMNNYLEETKSEWMTDNFLNNVTTNPKIQKLFTNPQYMRAIDLFKTNPKEAMVKYGGNKQFMEGFQEFCKLMGGQFQSLAKPK